MALPFFYVEKLHSPQVTLNEDTSKHAVGVLRMAKGESVLLTDGKGQKATATIIDDNRKRCTVQIQNTEQEDAPAPYVTIAISAVKNASRFEWFLEKATEIGVAEIVPLLCERTEKERFRYERMHSILVSAMLQSQQAWLPVLHQPTAFADAIKSLPQAQKFIAHCLPEEKLPLAQAFSPGHSLSSSPNTLILIGPEGDFTAIEIALALKQDFVPVGLGRNRLRTETAGIVAATLLRMR